MTARYLVQVRHSGEPWQTYGNLPRRKMDRTLQDALDLADALSAERIPYGLHLRAGTTCPRYAYVRVTFRGTTIYDPRHTDQRTPGTAPAPAQDPSPQRD